MVVHLSKSSSDLRVFKCKNVKYKNKRSIKTDFKFEGVQVDMQYIIIIYSFVLNMNNFQSININGIP
ncbi:hypothetical protein TUBRATIS_14500, partial [Tubulinosema ratisbonensis]